MPDLVTLNSAPYNPYNDTFARFAMQGLSMGIQMMQQKDALAQRQQEMLSNQISESTQNLYKGVELQMRNKEMQHRFENDQFNQEMDKQKFKFSQESFWKEIAMKEDAIKYERTQDATVNNPYKIAQTTAIQQQNDFNKLTFDDRVQASHMQLAKDAMSVATTAQQLQAGAMQNDYNAQTQAARIASANMQPAKDALGLASSAAQAAPYLNDPNLAAKQINTDIALKEAQTASDLGRADYYKNGGANKDAAKSSASAVSSILGAQSSLFKSIKTLKSAAAKSQLGIDMLEKGLKEGKMTDKERADQQKLIDEKKAGINDSSGQLKLLEAQAKQVSQLAEMTIEQHNEYLKKRGQQPIDTKGMSDEDKAVKALEIRNLYEQEDAQTSGKLPGSQAAPSPADRALIDNNAGKPVGTPSSNPPSSKYKALDFSDKPRPKKGEPGYEPYEGL